MKIICDGETILRKGHYNDKTLESYIMMGYQIYDNDTFNWIEDKTKHEVYNNNGKCTLLTVEMQIIKIRNKARVKFLEMKDSLDKEEKKKIQLTEMLDWTQDDEIKLAAKNKEYDKAIIDYDKVKKILVDNSSSQEKFQKCLPSVIQFRKI